MIGALIEAVDELGLPHPVHIHCNNLGHSGNYATTLDTMEIAAGHRAHITHIQFHSYGERRGKASQNPRPGRKRSPSTSTPTRISASTSAR